MIEYYENKNEFLGIDTIEGVFELRTYRKLPKGDFAIDYEKS